jgi:hypothetical protein
MEGNMKRKLIAFILIMMMILSSCSKQNNESQANASNNDNDKIQLWYYNRYGYENIIETYVNSIIKFCEDNDIPLEVSKFNGDTISIEDYILKRNIAASAGNMIILDEVQDLDDVASQHADYTKLDNYKNLFDVYKDRFCIPLMFQTVAQCIDNSIMKHYNIDTTVNKIITYSEYLEIKQEMKEKGARFDYNTRDYNELLAYYLNTNGLLLVDEKSESLANADEFKESLKKSITGICNDIILYNNYKLNKNIRSKSMNDVLEFRDFANSENIYDITSQLVFWGSFKYISGTTYTSDLFNFNIPNSTFLFNPIHSSRRYPYLYIYKKITNDKIYDVANYIISESSYYALSEKAGTRFMPILNTDITKQQIYANDDWKLKDDFKIDDEKRSIINTTYEMLFKSEEKSKEIASYLFYNEKYSNAIKTFVDDTVFDIARKLSGEELSLERFDPKNQEISKFIDNKINEFITNLKILYN